MGGACLAYVVCAYTAGQFASMFFRSGLLAGFFALVFSGCLLGWSALMLRFGVPWIWSIAPIPVILLAATWLRAPHWMLERNGLKGWLGTVGWLVGTVGLLLAAVVTYRVVEIPEVDPDFSVSAFSEPAAPEARVTADMYRRALDLVVPIANPKDQPEEETKEEYLARLKVWIEDNRASIDLALKASRRAECACDAYELAGQDRLVIAGGELGGLLIQQARLFNGEGELDAALDNYRAVLRISRHVRHRNRFAGAADSIEQSVYNQLRSWASRPGQTSERIRTAIEAVQRMMSDPPSPTGAMKAEYLIARRIVEGDLGLLGEVMGKSRPDLETTIRALVALQWMPWEKTRTMRLLNALTAEELGRLEEVEQALATGCVLPMPSHYPFDGRWAHRNQRWWALGETTLALRHFYDPNWYSEARACVDMATRRRATYLVLGLAAWKLEHHELPEKLDDLVGAYLSGLPPDPHTAEPFLYFREGIPTAITVRHDGDSEPRELLGAGEPFIWSTGWNVAVTGYEHDEVLEKYLLHDSYDSYQSPESEDEIWRRGEYFTIP
jgi:hypothetical protein